ncbi:MAG: single-stranded-DNA-specific exonuclease RecJ [Deltaproteobacteria bacterium]|nr:single-stranded-DNA-specific exonuclease RecJ [Deltaproteobacteria bacterium]
MSNPPAPYSQKPLHWVDPVQEYAEGSLRKFCDNMNISLGLGRILAGRNMLDEDRANRFLNPSLGDLHSPFLMMDMYKAVERISQALESHEKILVFGDYDVDGTASATILFSYLKRLGARIVYHIPHRIRDGYGLTEPSVRRFKGWNVDLVITVDHGSTDTEGARMIREAGMALIITDHHQVGPERPAALALVNPQQPDCTYPFKELSAAGVAFKLVCALDEHLAEHNFFERQGLRRPSPLYYLDLVAVATVADMAPLLGENRVLVKLGLDQLNDQPRPGFSGLIKECRIRGLITPSIISFKLAPKINALGRVGDPQVGMQLLLSHSFSESRRLARSLLEANRSRQEIEREALTLALQQSEAMRDSDALVLLGTDWHPGVLGTIATRIATETGKPTVVLTLYEHPYVNGSARSPTGFNVLNCLDACAHLLSRYGGHPNAAGLLFHPDQVPEFTRCFMAAVRREKATVRPGGKLAIESWVEREGLSLDFFAELSRLSPFGYRNPEPVLALRGLRLMVAEPIKFRNLRVNLLCPDGKELEAFAWDAPDWALTTGHTYDVAFKPQIQLGPEGMRTQMHILDIKPAGAA